MKKTIIALMITASFLAGCGQEATASAPASAPAEQTVEQAPADEITVVEDKNDAASPDAPVIEDLTADKDAGPEDIKEDTEEKTEENTEEKNEEQSAEDTTDNDASSKPKAIVWLGDSLTQGSLGDKDDNLANAPYVRLSKKVDVPVEGYGFYGYNTHDIFWMYRDETQKAQEIDPAKVYIFWVGSCDWCPDEGPNADTAPVISQIDNFLAQNGGVKNYIVIGTTSRWRLGDLYVPINNDLAAHYGSHYMDCIDIINKYGYSEDNTHLSQASYDAIADAVCDKLKALGYI